MAQLATTSEYFVKPTSNLLGKFKQAQEHKRDLVLVLFGQQQRHASWHCLTRQTTLSFALMAGL
jgi:hypothetical protein